jgi:alpha-1,2-mannosyltransferase
MNSIRAAWSRTDLGGALVRLALFNSILLNGVLTVCSAMTLWWHLLAPPAVTSGISVVFLWLFRGRQGDDSWRPMLHALASFRARLPIYQTVFFEGHDKFQYPLTSLLPLYWLEQWGWSDGGILKLMNVLTFLAFWLTLALTVRIFLFAAKQHGVLNELKGPGATVIAVSIGFLVLFFYPQTYSYALGQMQTFLALMFAGAVYLWLKGRYKAAGVLFGLMCLIKPQYSLFLIWFALRKKFGALASASIVLGLGWLVGGMVFGWRDQLAYLDVLRYIARHGESYWLNESLNGLLNHLLFNGEIMSWVPNAFAPYNPYIYGTSTLFAAGLIALALFYPHAAGYRGGVLDLGAMAITATVASPIAWHHHYAILLPVFGYLAGAMSKSAHRIALVAAFVLMSNSWSPLSLFARVPVLNAVLSLRFFAALLLLFVLYRNTRAKDLPTRCSWLNRTFPHPRPWTLNPSFTELGVVNSQVRNAFYRCVFSTRSSERAELR